MLAAKSSANVIVSGMSSLVGPSVVSVENVTQLIQDGQMIRVSGTEGYVEILS